LEINPLVILVIGIVTVLGMILVLRVNAFVALISAAMLVGLLADQVPTEKKIQLVAEQFGVVTGKIGIVIALAAMIGKCLMDSGAADRIVRGFLAVLGQKRAPLALLSSGYILSIPVFFDTVFYLMVPLAKAMRMRTGKDYVLYIMAISAGAVMTHSLVPPTPGPLTAGETLGVDIGVVMVTGMVIGLVGALVGLGVWGVYVNRTLNIPLRETPDVSLEELEALSKRSEDELPSLGLSLAPILLPVVLITTNTVLSALAESNPESYADAAAWAKVLGNANLALMLSSAIAMSMLAQRKRLNMKQLAVSMQPALASAGVIILITAGGGAFGGMLNAAGVGEEIKQIAGQAQVGNLLWLVVAFGISVVLKVAQGSGTVSIVVTSSMMASIVADVDLGYHLVYLVMAIGCGSKVGSWMNDSGFWIVCQMSGFTEIETLKTWTLLLVIMGLVGFAMTLLLAVFLPHGLPFFG